MSKRYLSTKTYGTDRGLSCCFRQWKATHSHCSTLHGYSIGIKLTFQSETLDDRNWVMDFGGLKQFKEWADHMFDHTLIIAKDDPHLETFKQLSNEDKEIFLLRYNVTIACCLNSNTYNEETIKESIEDSWNK